MNVVGGGVAAALGRGCGGHSGVPGALRQEQSAPGHSLCAASARWVPFAFRAWLGGGVRGTRRGGTGWGGLALPAGSGLPGAQRGTWARRGCCPCVPGGRARLGSGVSVRLPAFWALLRVGRAFKPIPSGVARPKSGSRSLWHRSVAGRRIGCLHGSRLPSLFLPFYGAARGASWWVSMDCGVHSDWAPRNVSPEKEPFLQ